MDLVPFKRIELGPLKEEQKVAQQKTNSLFGLLQSQFPPIQSQTCLQQATVQSREVNPTK